MNEGREAKWGERIYLLDDCHETTTTTTDRFETSHHTVVGCTLRVRILYYVVATQNSQNTKIRTLFTSHQIIL